MNAPVSPLAAAGIFLALSGCAVGPNYTRPTVATPVAFKDSAGWKTAAPAEALDRGRDDLERQAAAANPSLRVASANYEQARQLARADRATLFPTLTAGASAERARAGAGRSSTNTSIASSSSAPSRTSGATTNSFSATLRASWTPDF